MKNILIIGASSGIGLETATMLAGQGYELYTLSRNQNEKLFQLNTHHKSQDVLHDEMPADFLPEVLHGLVYCPGTINLKPFHRYTIEDFKNDFDINLLGAVKSIQASLPALKKANGSSVVLFSTVAVALGMPFHASIAAAKGAVEGLAKSLASEYAANQIRVNVIAPSLTHTPLAEKLLSSPEKIEASNKRHPLGRIGKPEDIASAVCYLLSSQSSWMTGQILHIDGGLSSLK